MDQQRLDAIRARCEAAVKELREMLPPKVDYAELVCAEGFTHGFHYVWQDPEPYMIDNAAKLIEELFGEVARLTADLAAMTAERDAMRERAEAAERDLDRYGQCGACKNHYRENGCGANNYSWCDGGFKWRGPQEDKPDDTKEASHENE